MNREIEFRAWVNHKKQMISDRHFDIDTWQNVIILKDSGASFSYHGSVKSCELMQYIGLKDKNNKKIFEGDILKLKYPVNYGFGGIHEIDIIVKVIYNQAAFWFEGIGYTDNSWHFYNDYEVIGNVYENPELLNQY